MRKPNPAATAHASPQQPLVAQPTNVPQPAAAGFGKVLADALDAAPQAGLTDAWDRGRELLSSHRNVPSFGREWVAAVALVVLGAVAPQTVPASAPQILVHAKPVLLGLGAAGAFYILLASMSTSYRIYERRVDVSRGVLFRRKSTLWLYDVTDIDYERSPLMLLTNTAALVFQSEAVKVPTRSRLLAMLFRWQGTPNLERVVGVGTAEEMERLWERLRNTALRERRAMKKQFV